MDSGQAHSTSLRLVWAYILSDLNRYRATDGWSYLEMLIVCPGTLASITYRIGNWLWYYSGRFALVVRLLRAVYIIPKRFVEIITGIVIAPHAHIGYGLYIEHFGSIFVGEDVVIGNNCNLSQDLTIGVSGRGNNQGSPHIGDRVYIAPGARVFGRLEIGNDGVISANAVVTKSMPDRAVAAGIPAEVISYEGSFEHIRYAGMETDPDRLESLASRKSEQLTRIRA